MANEDTRYHPQDYNSAERDRLEGCMREAGGVSKRALERWPAMSG